MNGRTLLLLSPKLVWRHRTKGHSEDQGVTTLGAADRRGGAFRAPVPVRAALPKRKARGPQPVTLSSAQPAQLYV